MTEQDDLPMIDTIAAMIKIEDLDRTVFTGESMSSNSDTGRLSVRLFLNVEGKPRVTYYPASGWLRVEWSGEHTIRQVNEYVSTFVDAPSVMTWRCQRVDYMVDLVVGNVAPYLAALSRLQVGAMQRNEYPDGVVWKASSRWLKMYDAKRHGKDGVLRFEVSNHKQAVRYMAKRWFGCDRTVQEMVHPGRVLYVLARYWETLGLHKGFADEEREVSALRDVFGQRSLAGAIHALRCVRVHGIDSYKTLQLMSRSSYYRWSSALRKNGFLAASNDDLSVVHLPTERIFLLLAQNLKIPTGPPAPYTPDKSVPKNWAKLALVLGVKPGVKPVKYLEERYERNLDGLARDSIEDDSVSTTSIVHPGPVIGASS